MIDHEFKAQKGRIHQALPDLDICRRELWGAKLQIFMHVNATSTLSLPGHISCNDFVHGL